MKNLLYKLRMPFLIILISSFTIAAISITQSYTCGAIGLLLIIWIVYSRIYKKNRLIYTLIACLITAILLLPVIVIELDSLPDVFKKYIIFSTIFLGFLAIGLLLYITIIDIKKMLE